MPFQKVNIAEKVKKMMNDNPEFKKAYLEARDEYKQIKEGKCKYGIYSPSTLKLVDCNKCEFLKGHCIMDDLEEEI